MIFKREEQIISELSALYSCYGYRRFKPANFEEYSLYQENKDFLISKNVITFSDLSGRLMAIRPDVTLSLIKRLDVAQGDTEKLYYHEKVFRQASGGKNYKEIEQTGVEVVGLIDDAVTVELSLLICKTLKSVCDSYVLDISHMGFTEGLLSCFGNLSDKVAVLLKEKNLHDFLSLAKQAIFPEHAVKAYRVVCEASGSPFEILDKVKAVTLNSQMDKAVAELEKLCVSLDGCGLLGGVNINFSAVGNADYYDGFIFNGYINGIPHCVLSGGQYGRLLEKMGKSGGAIGFALYLGEIERYLQKPEYSVDCLILYDNSSQQKALNVLNGKLGEGKSARMARVVPVGLGYGQLLDLTATEVRK